MNDRTLFTTFWTDESRTTRKVLARIPEGATYRPDPKSRTAQEIAWQIVCEEKMLIEALESGKAEWAPAPAPATMKEMVETYDRQRAGMAQRVNGRPGGRGARTAARLRRRPDGGEPVGGEAAIALSSIPLRLRRQGPPPARAAPGSDGL